MMKRRNVVMGVILASVLIAAIIIQATFGVGVGGGVRVVPTEMPLTQNTTKTFTIILQSPQDDHFDVTIIPGTCDRSWFAWLAQPRVRVEPRVQTQLYLDVRPTDSGVFNFKVRAESSRGDPFESDYIEIISEPPPSPTPTTSPTPSPSPTCIGLMPDLPSPQKIMTITEKKVITWTAFACDPDGDTLKYRFCVRRVGLLGWNCTEWITSNEWTWKVPLHSDYQTHPTASYDIIVDVRDGKHYTDFTVPNCDCSYEYLDYQITVNEQPECACLIPDPGKFSPQEIYTPIKWTACAFDPEGDQDKLWYRFGVDGVMQGTWDTNNTWTWIPNTSGFYEINVWVRDNLVPLSEPSYFDKRANFEDYYISS